MSVFNRSLNAQKEIGVEVSSVQMIGRMANLFKTSPGLKITYTTISSNVNFQKSFILGYQPLISRRDQINVGYHVGIVGGDFDLGDVFIGGYESYNKADYGLAGVRLQYLFGNNNKFKPFVKSELLVLIGIVDRDFYDGVSSNTEFVGDLGLGLNLGGGVEYYTTGTVTLKASISQAYNWTTIHNYGFIYWNSSIGASIVF